MYTLDTNVIIYHLHDDKSVRVFVDEQMLNSAPLYISVITETELLRFPTLSSSEETAIFDLLSILSIVSLDSRIARNAGMLGRMYNLKLADSVIAATALFTGTTLVTRNVRDFKRVPQLKVEKI